jgi:hypothetical protein
MNKTEAVEMLQRRTTKLAVFSAVFVGIMVVLVPILIEEADARITATAITLDGLSYTNVRGEMFLGKFVSGPTIVGPNIKWVTMGSGIIGGGNEWGKVIAFVEGPRLGGGTVEFQFFNPARGENTCSTKVDGGGSIGASCNITQEVHATASYRVFSTSGENDNIYCNILNKFGGDQIKVIRDKLNC